MSRSFPVGPLTGQKWVVWRWLRMLPSISNARDRTNVCRRRAPQLKLQPRGVAKQTPSLDTDLLIVPADELLSSTAAPQGPSSSWTCTAAIGAPHAAPMTVYWPFRRVTRAGADLSWPGPTVVDVHTVWAVTLPLTNSDVVPRHHVDRHTTVHYVNASQPFDICHSVPAWSDEPHREPMLRRKRLAVHFIAKQVVGYQRLVDGHAASELLRDRQVKVPWRRARPFRFDRH